MNDIKKEIEKLTAQARKWGGWEIQDTCGDYSLWYTESCDLPYWKIEKDSYQEGDNFYKVESAAKAWLDVQKEFKGAAF